ncbi:hypothetical protein TNCV_1683431 [Trichonephila clavipes]|nr:hypothetical protein TNCV_1683431 [Trichonephila clavipes]
MMNCQTKLRINHLAAVKSVAILESNANLNFYTWKKTLCSCIDRKGKEETIIVSSDTEDQILIPALQEYVPELALLKVTREDLIEAKKKARRLNPYTNKQSVRCQTTNKVYALENGLLVKNHEDQLGNVVKLIVVP